MLYDKIVTRFVFRPSVAVSPTGISSVVEASRLADKAKIDTAIKISRITNSGKENRDVGKIVPFINATTMKWPENCSLKYLEDKNPNNFNIIESILHLSTQLGF